MGGPDGEMDLDDILLMNRWWNVTVLSVLSNLNLNWFDNMVFWASFDPQKIELLFKKHVVMAEGARILDYTLQNDHILEEYDQKVFNMLRHKGHSNLGVDHIAGHDIRREFENVSQKQMEALSVAPVVNGAIPRYQYPVVICGLVLVIVIGVCIFLIKGHDLVELVPNQKLLVSSSSNIPFVQAVITVVGLSFAVSIQSIFMYYR